jgi:Ca2+/Na+ antiporter
LGGGLDRYLIIFQYLAENDDVFRAIDLATSGRLYDVFAVIDRLGDNMFNWLFGIGFGAVFTIDYSFSDESHITHYSHVTPFSYLLLGGFLLLIVVYAKLLLEIKYALKKIDDHLSMMLVYFFVIGFSGAIFFTDVFVWLIIGMFTAARIKAQKIQ